MKCKTRIMISWFVMGLAILVFSIVGKNTASLVFAASILSVLIRNARCEKEYWQSADKVNGLLPALAFIWSLSFLGYIMYEYYNVKPIGSHTMTGMQWALFLVPMVLVYFYYDFKLYKNCEDYYNE